MDIETAKNIGIAAAYRGAATLRSHFGKISHVNKKGRNDLVTEADTASERLMIDTIRTAFPHHTILAEESGLDAGTSEDQWFIDPLDGTTNFAHGLPLFAISVAYAVKGEIVLGIVLNPLHDELFTAVIGKGATLNSRPICVSSEETVSDSLLATGFPYNFSSIHTPTLTRFSNCLAAAQGVRRLGAASLDLCYVACGKFGGYWEQNLQPWDTAAGFLIAKEAGGVITDFSNRSFTVEKRETLATNGKIHQEMLTLLSIEDTL